MTLPDVLLFDLGGVLIENSGFAELRRLCPDPMGDAEVRARWLSSQSLRAFELGQIRPDEFASRFVVEWDLGLSAEVFLSEFEGWPKDLFPGAAELLAHIRLRQRVACLSNSNELHWSSRERVRNLFDHVFLSHELGLIKPDPDIFQHVIQRLGVEPGRITFFDDSPENVEAASRAGMDAHRVVGISDLEHTLSQLGIFA